jgi:hypothetical protein
MHVLLSARLADRGGPCYEVVLLVQRVLSDAAVLAAALGCVRCDVWCNVCDDVSAPSASFVDCASAEHHYLIIGNCSPLGEGSGEMRCSRRMLHAVCVAAQVLCVLPMRSGVRGQVVRCQRRRLVHLVHALLGLCRSVGSLERCFKNLPC